MRNHLPWSFWFVSLPAAALMGCGPSVDPTPLAESASECAEVPNMGADIAMPAPDPGGVAEALTAIGVARPELGPLTDILILPRDLGYACELGPECASGQCFDGVCCDVSCGGTCEACNLEGSVGFCIAHAAGTDPENGCGATECYNGVQEAFSCNGTGACKVKIASCEPYACGEAACLDACRNDADCAGRADCHAGKCVPE